MHPIAPPIPRPLPKPHLHTLNISPPELPIQLVPLRLRAEPYRHRLEAELRQSVLEQGGGDALALVRGEDHEGAEIWWGGAQ